MIDKFRHLGIASMAELPNEMRRVADTELMGHAEKIMREGADKIERLRTVLELFIETVNPPYPQSMALWQEHLKAVTETAKKELAQ